MSFPFVMLTKNALIFQTDDSGGSKNVKEQYDYQLNLLKKYVGWSNEETNAFNVGLKEMIDCEIKRTIGALEKMQSETERMDLPPLREKKSTFNIPLKRRDALKVKIERRNTSEPAIRYEDYREIIDIINDQGCVMEQDPSTFKSLDEPNLRSLLLPSLNALTKLSVSGETFNGVGKTDICLKYESKNIFVSECKIWSGAENFKEAIDQLFGYTIWRDGKTALIVFSRNKDMTNVVQSADECIRNHPNFMRFKEDVTSTIKVYVMKHPKDLGKEVFLALIAFNLFCK